MSNTDKAHQKLVASMRKSKAGGAPAPAKKKSASSERPSSRAKTSTTATRAAKKTAPRRGAAVMQELDTDPYQAKPRVWPD
jgi:hypothetical protein